jgi:hypothetical protein
MRQKYFISRDSDKGQLKIREYANILRNTKKATSTLPSEDTFSFLYEETYDGVQIRAAIDGGVSALIAVLRTRNLFPAWPNAKKIAESIVAIYEPGGNRSIELFFDDHDLFLGF